MPLLGNLASSIYKCSSWPLPSPVYVYHPHAKKVAVSVPIPTFLKTSHNIIAVSSDKLKAPHGGRDSSSRWDEIQVVHPADWLRGCCLYSCRIYIGRRRRRGLASSKYPSAGIVAEPAICQSGYSDGSLTAENRCFSAYCLRGDLPISYLPLLSISLASLLSSLLDLLLAKGRESPPPPKTCIQD